MPLHKKYCCMQQISYPATVPVIQTGAAARSWAVWWVEPDGDVERLVHGQWWQWLVPHVGEPAAENSKQCNNDIIKSHVALNPRSAAVNISSPPYRFWGCSSCFQSWKNTDKLRSVFWRFIADLEQMKGGGIRVAGYLRQKNPGDSFSE